MAGIKETLLHYGPQLAMAFMAAKQGGPYALAQFQQGLQQAQMRQEALGMREQEMGMRQQGLDQSAAMQAAQLQNLNADNARQDEAARINKFQQALALMERAAQFQGETAMDPEAAQAALTQQAGPIAQAYGLPADQLTSALPPVAPMISARKRKQAQAIYERAEKRFNPKGENPEWESSVTLQTGDLFGDITPSNLRALFDAPAIDASGAPMLPPKAKRALQLVDMGGKKVAIDPTELEAGDTFTETPSPSSASGTRFWVMRNGKPLRITEAEYQPGDQPASNREQGRPVTSGDAGHITDLDTSLSDLATLELQLGTTGAVSKVGAMLPNVVTEYTGWGSDAKQRQAVIDRVKQVIGKALEGGVLRKEDEYKYIKILPTIGDPPEVAKTKLQGLRTAIQQRRAITLENLGSAGFDTTKFTPTAQPPASGSTTDADPLGLFK